MTDLAEFILARLSEWEADAKAADWGPRWVMAHDLPNCHPAILAHIMRYDPARVLADVEAKRQICGPA